MTRAFVFPGQGSQRVGMGRELAEAFAAARLVFGEVDEALDQHLFRLMCEGPESEVTLTENAQPALMAVSLAVVRVLESEGGFGLADKCAFVAGHSLGEYAALAAAGSLALADTARLLRQRGLAMQRAVPVGEGAMAALIGLDLDAAEAVAAAAAEGEACAAANDNAPGQVVISGARAAVERAMEIAPDHGARRAIALPVSAPFHCSLMAPAAEVMAEALDATTVAAPRVPLVANASATAVTAPDDIRRLLVEQVTAMVRWRESVLYMREHEVDTTIELGAGKVLSGLARRIDRDLAAASVETPEDVETFLKTV
ncbi:MAG: ACP S-malonyltransferase [Alphaproteobacteria bacterium]